MAEAQRYMCVFGDDDVTECVCQKGFTKFRSGDFKINDMPCSSCPIEIDSSKAKVSADANSSQMVQQIATLLNISHAREETICANCIMFPISVFVCRIN